MRPIIMQVVHQTPALNRLLLPSEDVTTVCRLPSFLSRVRDSTHAFTLAVHDMLPEPPL